MINHLDTIHVARSRACAARPSSSQAQFSWLILRSSVGTTIRVPIP
jgi:hypothetical protein